MWAYEELLELYEKEKDAETKERLLAISVLRRLQGLRNRVNITSPVSIR